MLDMDMVLWFGIATAARTSSPLDRSLIKHSLPLRGGVRLGGGARSGGLGVALPKRASRSAARRAARPTTISHTRSVTPTVAASAWKACAARSFVRRRQTGSSQRSIARSALWRRPRCDDGVACRVSCSSLARGTKKASARIAFGSDDAFHSALRCSSRMRRPEATRESAL